MSKRWLNHYLVTSGTWADGQSDLVDTFMSIEFTPPTDVVFHETAHSGHVLLTRSGETSSSHGHGGGGKSTVHTGPTMIVIADTQIYLNIVSVTGAHATSPHRSAFPSSSRTSRRSSCTSSSTSALRRGRSLSTRPW